MRRILAAVAVTAVIVGLTIVWAAVAAWCQHFFGFASNGGNDSHYLFWSGVGSDMTEYVIIGGLIQLYWQHSCHEPRCFWPGHMMADGHTRSCWHHHPEGRPQAGHVARKHAEHKARTAVSM